jgi:hypothetical protein
VNLGHSIFARAGRLAAGWTAAVVLVAGCTVMPWEDENRPPASVENRRVPESRTAKPEAKPQPARVAEAKADPENAELRRVIDRQSKRIAELEARAPEGSPETRQVTDLLAFAQRLAALSPEEQGREYEAARQDNARETSVYSRLRLALVLSTPGTAFQDDARALALLEPVAAQPARGPLRQLAAMVHGLVGERVREQKRVAQLKEQIDGLRAIDRSLIDRDPGRGK